MTFFDKLFTSKNKFFKCDLNSALTCAKSRNTCNGIDLGLENIRVVLFRECERRGRKLLFDSDAVEKISPDCSGRLPSSADIVETSATHAYKYKKPNKDVSSLGEMIFGSVAVASKGGSISKIHNMSAPHRLMFTTVMPTHIKCHPRSIRSHQDSISGPSQSTNGCQSNTPSLSNCSLLNKKPDGCVGTSVRLHRTTGCSSLLTLAAPPRTTTSSDSKIVGMSRLESGCYDDFTQSAPTSRRASSSKPCSFGTGSSLLSSLGSLCDSKLSNASINCSGGSLNSLRRRWQQSLAVSLDATHAEEGKETCVRVRTKLGLALILTLTGPNETELEKFLLSNSITMESILQKLQAEVEVAYSRHEAFVQLSLLATEAASIAIVELLRKRKDLQPIWTRPGIPARRCRGTNSPAVPSGQDLFVSNFCEVLQLFDTKDTNFFVSTLLTALLTHNLSWVTNVASKMPNFNHLGDREEEKIGLNPLWAQHCEMFGAVTLPLRIAKIVLADPTSRPHLNNLLEVLTYFIRGTPVIENTFEADLNEILNNLKERPTIPVKEVNGKTWFFDENFDSGVDCEMRDALFSDFDMAEIVTEASIFSKTENSTVLEPETSSSFIGSDTYVKSHENVVSPPKRAFEALVTSSMERTRPIISDLDKKDCSTKFVDNLSATEGARQCCNSLKNSCTSSVKISKTDDRQSLYPDLTLLAEMENVRLEDLTSERDKTVFVENVLKMIERSPVANSKVGEAVSPVPDEGYETLHGDARRDLAKNVVFELGGDNTDIGNRTVVTKAMPIEADQVSHRVRRCPKRSRTINIPVFQGLKLLQIRSRTMEDVGRFCSEFDDDDSLFNTKPQIPVPEPSDADKLLALCEEISMPCCPEPLMTRVLSKCPVLGGVYSSILPQFTLQAITKSSKELEADLRSDLSRMSMGSQCIPEPTEAVYVLADLSNWTVNLHSTSLTTLGAPRSVQTTASQLVADMLESFSNLRRAGLPSQMCLEHIERKLEEMYRKSMVVAEMLMTTEFCTLDKLTSRLHIAINDVPLLLAIATTHTPGIAEKYGVTFS